MSLLRVAMNITGPLLLLIGKNLWNHEEPVKNLWHHEDLLTSWRTSDTMKKVWRAPDMLKNLVFVLSCQRQPVRWAASCGPGPCGSLGTWSGACSPPSTLCSTTTTAAGAAWGAEEPPGMNWTCKRTPETSRCVGTRGGWLTQLLCSQVLSGAR